MGLILYFFIIQSSYILTVLVTHSGHSLLSTSILEQRMKQKIVIKVQVRCDKCRSKAMEIAAAADGVISVALEGDNKDKVVVTGDGVDSVNLTVRLRKKLGHARLDSVEQVVVKQEKPAVNYENKDIKPTPSPTIYASTSSCQQSRCAFYEVVYDPRPSTCNIM